MTTSLDGYAIGALLAIVSSCYCVCTAHRISCILRFLASIPIVALIPFLIFSYLASFESGIHSGWKVGYGLATAVCVAAVCRLWLVGLVVKRN